MTFKPHQSGNPSGRPKGIIDKRSKLRQLLIPHAEEVITKLIEQAKQGDVNAMRLVIERLIPRPKDESIYFELPSGELSSTKTLMHIGGDIIDAVASGQITPDEGEKLCSLIESQRKNIETSEIAKRISDIEQTLKHRKEESKNAKY